MIGRIYRIIHLESDICYIGSTFNELRKRWQAHRGDFSTYTKGKRGSVSIYPHMQEHGIDKFKMILVKAYEVVDKIQLRAYEQLWINKFRKTAINQANPFYIKKLAQKDSEQRRDKKSRAKSNKKWREANIEALAAKKKEYRDVNKEALAAKKAIKIQCECGGIWTKGQGIKRHEKSKKHISHLAATT